jgi:hypothetical protein
MEGGERMTEDAKPFAADAGATITEAQLRKAEEYVESGLPNFGTSTPERLEPSTTWRSIP